MSELAFSIKLIQSVPKSCISPNWNGADRVTTTLYRNAHGVLQHSSIEKPSCWYPICWAKCGKVTLFCASKGRTSKYLNGGLQSGTCCNLLVAMYMNLIYFSNPTTDHLDSSGFFHVHPPLVLSISTGSICRSTYEGGLKPRLQCYLVSQYLKILQKFHPIETQIFNVTGVITRVTYDFSKVPWDTNDAQNSTLLLAKHSTLSQPIVWCTIPKQQF